MSSVNKNRIHGFGLGLILAVGILAMSSASILIRFAQSEAVPSIIIAAYRLVTASVVVSVFTVRQRTFREYATLPLPGFVSLGLAGLLLGLHFATWISSLAYTTVMSSAVLVTTTPIWVAIAAPIILKERVKPWAWVGILVALGGVLVVSWGDASTIRDGQGLGNILAVLGAICMAGYLIIGRDVRDRLSLWGYLALVYTIAGLSLIFLALAFRYPIAGYSPSAVFWMVSLGIIPQLVGHSAANFAVRHLPATLVAVAIVGEPVGSTLLAMLVLDEWPVAYQFGGSLAIIAGVVIAARSMSPNGKTGDMATDH